ncbi:MAG: glutamine-hydrolyzing GMP synthase [Planctomycetes bacterium]|nr:glutamine-hydrolyzing GMP synthase [Planctomycetota bacterium]
MTAIHEEVLVVDYGSQFNQLIARRVREQNVFCRVVMPDITAAELRANPPKGIILSGGPASVYDEGAPTLDPEILDLGVPILGICYGMGIIMHVLGSRVEPGEREFGHRELDVDDAAALFIDTPARQVVWMSHGDQVTDPGGIFKVLARTDTCPNAAVVHKDKPIYAIQFHPEVAHTEHGKTIITNFLTRVCHCSGDWEMSSFVNEWTERIRELVGDDRVLCGVSGGVDSTVASALVHRAIGDQLTCVFVDNGLLRHHEAEEVVKLFRDNFEMDFRHVDATDQFLAALEGVSDPETKRKRIGHTFIEVFQAEKERAAAAGAKWLVQGTLYPDVIESVSAHGGPSATIKTHHNVGGLPEDLGFQLLEPLRDLFKDEVRRLGTEMGLSDELVWRQPFPGPGLAVRILGDITRERLAVLRQADAIVREEIAAAGLERDLWQWFAVLLPVQSVGVMGDYRTYEDVCAVRAVTSTDAMTAEWARLPGDVLAAISRRIVNGVRGINRVVYDISSKPPSTIEWE